MAWRHSDPEVRSVGLREQRQLQTADRDNDKFLPARCVPLTRVARCTCARVAVQAPQCTRATVEAGVRVARVGHRDLAQGG